MKSWKKAWNAELDRVLEQGSPKNTATSFPERKISRKKIWSFSLVGIATAIVISLVAYFSLLTPPTVPSVLVVEINPSAIFVLDEDGIVAQIASGNLDADTILSDQTRKDQMVNKSAEESIKLFIDYAIDLGFMDVNGDEMTISSCDGDTNDLKSNISDYLKSKGNNLTLSMNKTTPSDLGEKVGVSDFTDVKGFVGKLKDLPELFGDRPNGGRDDHGPNDDNQPDGGHQPDDEIPGDLPSASDGVSPDGSHKNDEVGRDDDIDKSEDGGGRGDKDKPDSGQLDYPKDEQGKDNENKVDDSLDHPSNMDEEGNDDFKESDPRKEK